MFSDTARAEHVLRLADVMFSDCQKRARGKHATLRLKVAFVCYKFKLTGNIGKNYRDLQHAVLPCIVVTFSQ